MQQNPLKTVTNLWELEQEGANKGFVLDFQREFGKNKEDGNCENKGDDPRNDRDDEGE